MKKFFLAALLCSSLAYAQTPAPAPVAAPAVQQEEPLYLYASNDAEYTVPLPEAPKVETIWADDGKVPYLENPPTIGATGEIATVKVGDMETEENFEVKITFLSVNKAYLDGLTKEKMQTVLETDMKSQKLESQSFNFSQSPTNGLKWATLSGFTLDKESRASYNVEHYLTGKRSLMIIRVKFNVDNKKFADYYRKLVDGIKFHPV